MNEVLKEWATPNGVMVILAGLVVLGMIAQRVLRAIGKTEAADKVQELTAQTETLQLALGSVMKGVQNFKVKSPTEAAALIDQLRATNKATGAEVVIAPIVRELNQDPTAAPMPIVRAATTRITRRVS